MIEVPQLKIRDQVIRGLKLQTGVENHVANFTLDSDVLTLMPADMAQFN